MNFSEIRLVLLRYWLLIFIAAVGVGGTVFLTSYYHTIIKKDYVSNIQYTFIYSVKTFDKSDDTYTWKLAQPTMYMNVYQNAFTDEEVYAAVSRALKESGDEKQHYSVRELQSMVRVTQSESILKLSATTKNSAHSAIVLKLIVKTAEASVESVVDQMTTAEQDFAKLTISKQPDIPTQGTIYEKEDSYVQIVLRTVFSLVGVAVGVSLLIVLLSNFNGRFRRRDVFENNYGIAVLGEVSVRMSKIKLEDGAQNE